ncbi:MAG: SusD/RagB family nutrient-binding outer membrane lipoprotein [Cyclobacteriaceae bacterium]
MKKFLIVNILFATLLFSCDDWLDVNTDPNNPTEINPDLILPVAQHYSARIMQEDRGINHLGNMMMVNWSESGGFSWYNDEFLYLANSTFYNEIFDYTYHDALKQYADLDDLGDEYSAYKAISMIMKSFHFQILVDLYGDIPYAEALQRSDNPTPAYTAATVVYDDLLVQLTNAIELMDAAEADPLSIVPEGDDVMFGGDLMMWKQFANTIKLRILNRVSGVKDAAFITAELAAIAAEGSGYISSDVEINPGYANQTDQQSPFWTSFGQSVNGDNTLTNNATCASEHILTVLTDLSDPRIGRLYEEPATGHLGVPQGVTVDPNDFGQEQVSNIGPGILVGPTQGAKIMTMAEMNFNLAELALNNFATGDAATLYNAGVTASFVSLGLTAADATTYLAQTVENVSYADSSDKLEAIITQKWLAMNGITAEQSWFDWVRTGFPLDLPISQEQPNLVRPVRLAYPASEVAGNSNNLPSQLPDPFTEKIFWAN